MRNFKNTFFIEHFRATLSNFQFSKFKIFISRSVLASSTSRKLSLIFKTSSCNFSIYVSFLRCFILNRNLTYFCVWKDLIGGLFGGDKIINEYFVFINLSKVCSFKIMKPFYSNRLHWTLSKRLRASLKPCLIFFNINVLKC